MRDRSSDPLTDEERLMFGHDAKRRSDGSIIEQGVKVGGSKAVQTVGGAHEPLRPIDKLVFGEDATRRPDGSIREAGSDHDAGVIAHRAELERRAGTAVKPERTIDLREVHAEHLTRQ
jgi:hypothetical protein